MGLLPFFRSAPASAGLLTLNFRLTFAGTQADGPSAVLQLRLLGTPGRHYCFSHPPFPCPCWLQVTRNSCYRCCYRSHALPVTPPACPPALASRRFLRVRVCRSRSGHGRSGLGRVSAQARSLEDGPSGSRLRRPAGFVCPSGALGGGWALVLCTVQRSAALARAAFAQSLRRGVHAGIAARLRVS